MKSEAAVDSESLITVARAVKTRALKGEVVADLLTDYPERFAQVDELFAVSPEGKQKPVKLEAFWFHQGRVILKFVGYDTVESAQTLVGSDFAVRESEAVQLPAGEFYEWQLEGCAVETAEGQRVGVTRGVI